MFLTFLCWKVLQFRPDMIVTQIIPTSDILALLLRPVGLVGLVNTGHNDAHMKWTGQQSFREKITLLTGPLRSMSEFLFVLVLW